MCVISQHFLFYFFVFSQRVRNRATALIQWPPATRGGYANRLTSPFEYVGRAKRCIDTPRRGLRSQLIPIWKHRKRWPSVPISKYVPIFLATLFKVDQPKGVDFERATAVCHFKGDVTMAVGSFCKKKSHRWPIQPSILSESNSALKMALLLRRWRRTRLKLAELFRTLVTE